MKRHSKHHTAKHMKYMRNLMMKGSTFTAAHAKNLYVVAESNKTAWTTCRIEPHFDCFRLLH